MCAVAFLCNEDSGAEMSPVIRAFAYSADADEVLLLPALISVYFRCMSSLSQESPRPDWGGGCFPVALVCFASGFPVHVTRIKLIDKR